MRRESGVSHRVLNHFLFSVWALSVCFCFFKRETCRATSTHAPLKALQTTSFKGIPPRLVSPRKSIWSRCMRGLFSIFFFLTLAKSYRANIVLRSKSISQSDTVSCPVKQQLSVSVRWESECLDLSHNWFKRLTTQFQSPLRSGQVQEYCSWTEILVLWVR